MPKSRYPSKKAPTSTLAGQTFFGTMYCMFFFHYYTWANESRPERVRLCVHTTEPTGPVPEPFHCDHISRWSARSGMTGRSGTGVNTGARLRSGTVPEPFRNRSGPKAVV